MKLECASPAHVLKQPFVDLIPGSRLLLRGAAVQPVGESPGGRRRRRRPIRGDLWRKHGIHYITGVDKKYKKINLLLLLLQTVLDNIGGTHQLCKDMFIYSKVNQIIQYFAREKIFFDT